ncbi:energy transducer TonB [Hyalangium rubrum]|uniref:Energy transducer TonB n=1 Tax=Hyalangium rubrum TaxID=3103134 RepID=A0ABU5HBH4_9BACT|nr:energy transducer TonB [Hyalangium sp. s54d21]MDY7230825.1 energy transducer TonB [Hyalangium sp. s54d21]
MFQSVVDQRGWRSGRIGTGAGVSVLVHAGVFAAALFLSAGAAKEITQEPPEVVFKVAPPQPPRGNPNPSTPKQVAQPKPKPKPKKFTQPSVIPPTPPPEVEPATTPEPDPVDDLPYIEGSDPDGVDEGGVPGAKVITGLEQALTALEPTGDETVPFGQGMKPPKLVSGAPIQYTREALEASVRGMLVAKCVITREGEVENCKVIKGLPHMDVAVLSALETRQYSPVMWQGKPISVSYMFNIKLEMPR